MIKISCLDRYHYRHYGFLFVPLAPRPRLDWDKFDAIVPAQSAEEQSSPISFYLSRQTMPLPGQFRQKSQHTAALTVNDGKPGAKLCASTVLHASIPSVKRINMRAIFLLWHNSHRSGTFVHGFFADIFRA